MYVGLAIFLIGFASVGFAQTPSSVSEAKWLLERLTGVKWPADAPVLSEMAQKISQQDRLGAAELATQQSQFLNVTVKQMALRMSTREESVREPFNDFAAGFIGVTRDNRDARELLYGNFFYSGDPAKLAGRNVPSNLAADIINSNNHYAALERANVDLGDVLVRNNQQRLIRDNNNALVNNPDPAGILTSRTFLAAHAEAGTNRRLVEFTFREFMCIPIEKWADTAAPDTRIGRDIDRFPGGDNFKFLTTCKGCHSVMDGFRGAFAKWDFRGTQAIHTAAGGSGRAAADVDPANNTVVRKMNRPEFIQYGGGYVTTNDSWVNNADRGINSTVFGWRGLTGGGDGTTGNGVNGFGRLVANSMRFSQCMAKRVFASVCKYEPSGDQADLLYVSLGMEFEKNNYNLRKLFQIVATHPDCRL